jgi:hypothetical protein
VAEVSAAAEALDAGGSGAPTSDAGAIRSPDFAATVASGDIDELAGAYGAASVGVSLAAARALVGVVA